MVRTGPTAAETASALAPTTFTPSTPIVIMLLDSPGVSVYVEDTAPVIGMLFLNQR